MSESERKFYKAGYADGRHFGLSELEGIRNAAKRLLEAGFAPGEINWRAMLGLPDD